MPFALANRLLVAPVRERAEVGRIPWARGLKIPNSTRLQKMEPASYTQGSPEVGVRPT
jgi:hypothetical protein